MLTLLECKQFLHSFLRHACQPLPKETQSMVKGWDNEIPACWSLVVMIQQTRFSDALWRLKATSLHKCEVKICDRLK